MLLPTLFSHKRDCDSCMLSEAASPRGKPYCDSGKPCSYNACPVSCMQLQVILLKLFSFTLVVMRTSVLEKLMVKGCSLISCLPASKSKFNSFIRCIPQFH